MREQHIIEPSRKTPLLGEYEVVVARRRTGRHCRRARGRARGPDDAADRALRLHGRRRHGRGPEHVLRPARGRARPSTSRSCTASPTTSSSGSRAMDGLNKPHLTVARSDHGAGLRHLRVQDRGRRAHGRGQGQACCSTRSASAPSWPTTTSVSTPCSSRRNRAAARSAARSSSTARATAISRPGPACRTRSATAPATCCIRRRCSASTVWTPSEAGRAWELIPSLMDEAEKTGPALPAQEADRAPAAQPDRVARESHADQKPRRHGRQRHRCRPAELRRGRRPAAMLGRVRVHQERDAGLRASLHRRDRAADRHPRDAAHRRRVRADRRRTSSAAAISTMRSA